MKIDVSPAEHDSGVTCLWLRAENDEEKQELDTIFSQCAGVCQCKKGSNILTFIIKPQRTLVRNKNGELVDIFLKH